MKLAGDWAPQKRKIEPLPWPDILLANLEGPLLSNSMNYQVLKAGPHLANYSLPNGPKKCILTLANNHMMDYGYEGLNETIRTLKNSMVYYVGAGKNKSVANSPLFIEVDGVRLCILSRCEHQFGISSHRRPGVAGFDIKCLNDIRKLKKEADIVIVSIHAAAEMCPWPSPNRQDTWRALAEAGADIVHGHHAHVPQGYERYHDSYIFYGLGNLCADPVVWSKHPHALWSLVPDVSFSDSKFLIKPSTAVIQDMGQFVKIRDPEPLEEFEHETYLEKCNRPLSDRNLLSGLWQEASIRAYQSYYGRWLGLEQNTNANWRKELKDLLLKAMRRFQIKNKKFCFDSEKKSKFLLLYHLFVCESHNDAISTALGVLGGELEDYRTEETFRLVDEMMP